VNGNVKVCIVRVYGYVQRHQDMHLNDAIVILRVKRSIQSNTHYHYSSFLE